MESKSFDLSNRVYKIVFVLGVLLGLFWLFRVYEIWNTVSGNYAREISVEGQGMATIVPDTATIRLGVRTEAKTSEEAVTKNSEKMNAVISAIKDLGVDEAHIKTTNYTLRPNYDYGRDDEVEEGEDEEGRRIVGYSLDQIVELKLTDFEKIGTLVGAASEAGANAVESIDFSVENPEAARVEAREEAVAIAKEKIKQIEASSGLNVGRLVNYYEYSSDYDGKGARYYSESVEELSVSAPEFYAGEEEVTLTVTLTYQIR